MRLCSFTKSYAIACETKWCCIISLDCARNLSAFKTCCIHSNRKSKNSRSLQAENWAIISLNNVLFLVSNSKVYLGREIWLPLKIRFAAANLVLVQYAMAQGLTVQYSISAQDSGFPGLKFSFHETNIVHLQNPLEIDVSILIQK